MVDNLLLQSLPPDLSAQLSPELTRVSFRTGEVMLRPGVSPDSVLFPTTSVISLVTEIESGGSVEAGMVGYEGFVGLSIFLGGATSNVRGIAQVGGDALSLPASTFRHQMQDERFRDIMGSHAGFLFALAGQSIACQAFHTVEQRLARWLLMVQDRAQSRELPLTQDFLASMLGVQRPTVTVTARLLQAAGLIQYRHGKIVVLDHQGLEDSACECYRLVGGLSPTD